jgi:ankyrin repeat protein
LILAARNGHTDTVNALAGTHNANVEAVDEDGWTALMRAARDRGHTDTVNALAGTHNANVDAVDQKGLDGVDACRLGTATPTP